MQTLSTELKAVISRRLERADSREILTIASALCADEPAPVLSFNGAVESRFKRVGSCVRDNTTGLIWMQATLSVGRVKWNEAPDACAALDLDGYSNWRMPTIKELLTLVDYGRHEPAIDPIFQCESAWYWTATPLNSSPGGCAWGVGFYDGGASWSGRYYYGFVRAVRVGQF